MGILRNLATEGGVAYYSGGAAPCPLLLNAQSSPMPIDHIFNEAVALVVLTKGDSALPRLCSWPPFTWHVVDEETPVLLGISTRWNRLFHERIKT